jgi:alpha-L-fucosidase
MKRRTFIKAVTGLATVGYCRAWSMQLVDALDRATGKPRAALPSGPSVERTPALAAFERLRLGVSYSFSLNTFTGNDYETGAVPATTYNPTHLDVEQWIRIAAELGATYAVLTAKHMSGFCLWDSEGYDYSVATSGNKTDVMAAFMAACRKYGLMPGFYYCILDPHNEGKLDWTGPITDHYFGLIEHHITELHTRYPGAFYQLFDIPEKLSPDRRWALYRLVKRLNPTCLVAYNQCLEPSRHNQGRACELASWPTDVLNEEDTLPPPEGHDPHLTVEGKPYYLPLETWLPTGPVYMNTTNPVVHSWFWRPGYQTQSAETIVEAYHECMARNSNLLLNLAPDTTGRLPEEAVKILSEVAKKIRI